MLRQELMVEYQKATNSRQQMKTIEDMQNFVESFSDFSTAQHNAGKHVTLMSELNSAVVARNLMSVSSVCPCYSVAEISLACRGSIGQ